MKTPLLAIYLSAGLLASLSAQEAPAKPAGKAETPQQATKRFKATMNLKQIGAALFEFENDYGSFPHAETAKEVKKATGTALNLEGTSSNDYFRQLIAAGILKTEKIFQYGQTAKPADDKFATAAEALAQGECELAYLPGGSMEGEPARPIALGPLVPGKMQFDPEPFGGKAVVLRADHSVTSLPINEKGEVIINGKSLFDPSQPYWSGKKPVVAWPK